MKFDRVVCINLDRRYDRWDEFISQPEYARPETQELGEVERVSAIDGNRATHPPWWRSGAGAWGCYRSHLRVIEDAINSQQTSLLVFEDDALLCDDFGRKAQAYFDNLPDDWQWAYLGGQHWKVEQQPPVKVNDYVSRGWNIQRTHAYAIRGRSALMNIYRHLTRDDWSSSIDDPHHVDKQYGQLQQQSKVPIYCPPVFLVGQREGTSNIGPREQEERWWNSWSVTTSDSPMVAVLGPFRGGTSCTAGVLHTLGVSMGRHFGKAKPSNPKGFYEASMLAQICRRSYKEPWMKPQNQYEQRVSLLRMWANNRRKELDNAINGGKHPTMCLMGPEIKEAWGNVKWISVERPAAEVIKSLEKRGWGWGPDAPSKVLPNMIDTRDRFLSTVDQEDVLRIKFADLVADSMTAIDQMIEFLDIQPDVEQIQKAIEFVDPSLKTVTA